jgi:hypothetical protein
MWLPVFKYLVKFAKAGMFMFKTGQSYEGAYVETSTGKFYAGNKPGDESLELIYDDSEMSPAISEETQEFSGDSIYPEPSDYKKGFMMRYFLKKNTSDKIIEVTKIRYDKSISKLYFKGTSIKWILEKPVKDIFNQGYLFKGAATRNKENTTKGNLELKGLSSLITEFDKFVNIESDLEGYKFEELPPKEQIRIIRNKPSTLQKSPKKLVKPKFKRTLKKQKVKRELPPVPPRRRPPTGGGGGGGIVEYYNDNNFGEGIEGGVRGSNSGNQEISQY